MGQHDVHALQELLQVYLKVGTALNVLHLVDGVFQHREFILWIGDLLIDELLDAHDPAVLEEIQESLVTSFKYRKLDGDVLK